MQLWKRQLGYDLPSPNVLSCCLCHKITGMKSSGLKGLPFWWPLESNSVSSKYTSKVPDVPEVTHWPPQDFTLEYQLYARNIWGLKFHQSDIWNPAQIMRLCGSVICVGPGADLRTGCLPESRVGAQPHRDPAHCRATLVRCFWVAPPVSLCWCLGWKHRLWPFCAQLVADIALGGTHAFFFFSAMQGIPFNTSLFTGSRFCLESACKASRDVKASRLCSSSPVAQCPNNSNQ